jgi:hypothetical protein
VLNHHTHNLFGCPAQSSQGRQEFAVESSGAEAQVVDSLRILLLNGTYDITRLVAART